MSIFQLWPHPSARVERFTFEGDNLLYRDHLGRRVVADWEGDGTALNLRSDTQLQINGVPMDPLLFHPFANFAAITADSYGKTDVSLSSHIEMPSNSDVVESSNVEGCGFVLNCLAPILIDGTRRQVLVHETLPVPFFRSAESTEPFNFCINPNLQCRLLFRASIDALEAWRGVSRTVQNLSSVSNLDSTFDDGTRLEHPVASHLNGFAFNIEIPADCVGMRLRKLYDRFHGRQRTRVLIDEAPVSIWYAPTQNRHHRWAYSEFGAPIQPTSARSVRIIIDPPAGVPLWSVGELEVFGLFHSE